MAERDYEDVRSIADAAELWRRIPPWHSILDENQGRIRPSSAAFEDDEDSSPMSVLLVEVMLRTGQGTQEALEGHEGFALAAITAGLARSFRLGIAKDPLPEEPAHAVVFGRKVKSVSRQLAKQSKWVVPPPQQGPENP